MTSRPALAAFVVAAISLFAAGLALAQAPARTIRIVTFERESDPFYEPVRISVGSPACRDSALPGASGRQGCRPRSGGP